MASFKNSGEDGMMKMLGPYAEAGFVFSNADNYRPFNSLIEDRLESDRVSSRACDFGRSAE